MSLSGVAAVTKRIVLVTNIATWTRTPVTMARALRSLSQVSEGRFVLGLGSMPRLWNENYHGIPGRAPLSRMREYVELLRKLWNAQPRFPGEPRRAVLQGLRLRSAGAAAPTHICPSSSGRPVAT